MYISNRTCTFSKCSKVMDFLLLLWKVLFVGCWVLVIKSSSHFESLCPMLHNPPNETNFFQSYPKWGSQINGPGVKLIFYPFVWMENIISIFPLTEFFLSSAKVVKKQGGRDREQMSEQHKTSNLSTCIKPKIHTLRFIQAIEMEKWKNSESQLTWNWIRKTVWSCMTNHVLHDPPPYVFNSTPWW